MTYVAISVGAILGANLRYVLGGWISDRFASAFPLGTLVINLSGSLVIGFFLTLIGERIVPDPWWRPFFAIGFLGSYTTFSTFSYETLSLVRDGSLALAGLNVLASVGLGLLGVYLGAVIARAI